MVLDGAREALTQIVGVQLELPLVHLYRHTWSLADALAYLDEVGFVLAQVDPFNWLGEDPVSAVEVEAVFRRRDRVDELGAKSREGSAVNSTGCATTCAALPFGTDNQQGDRR
jgi:hypothetical protein